MLCHLASDISADREYIIKDDDTDRVLRRNRKFLRPQVIEPMAPPRQPVSVPQPLTEVEPVLSVPSESRANPVKNIRPQRQKKPIVRFMANMNQYYESEPEDWEDYTCLCILCIHVHSIFIIR